MNQSWVSEEWRGSRPQRFSGGIRYIEPKDQLTSFVNQSFSTYENKGIKTYTPQLSPEK